MKILICTGIFPPQLGGPAKYAKNLADVWKAGGNTVAVKTYTVEHSLPTGIRHLYYFFKIIPAVLKADVVFALDTFSVGFPAVLATRIFGKPIVIRTGGDFLWEGYVERTGNLVLLKDFYTTTRSAWSRKEKIIFSLTKFALKSATEVVFSTVWQRDIFTRAYSLSEQKTSIVENYYGPKIESNASANMSTEQNIQSATQEKVFLAGVRQLKWKNVPILARVFEGVPAILDTRAYAPAEYAERMKNCYAAILVSLGDISPNMILEAIQCNKPFILTKENGLMERVKDIGIFVDPKSEKDIREKVVWLLDEDNYRDQVRKVSAFTFTHTWEEIAREFVEIFRKYTKQP